MFYVIATPIGNLKDISFRAIETLKKVDCILAEDTRTTQKLLNHFKISKPVLSYHQHSKLSKTKYVLEKLKKGESLALVSEAGTPGISDPGGKLIEYLIKELPGLEIVPIPGPSTLATALSISGFPSDKFIFLGFPPIKKKRKKFFEEVVKAKYTTVLYESPYRIIKTLTELNLELQVTSHGLQVVVCRELTKKFETIYRGNIQEVIQKVKQDPIKGEFVIVIKK